MAKRTRAERVLCKLLAFAAVLSALAPAGVRAGAQTALSQDDFDALVSQYTISKEAIGYQEYISSHGQHRPQAELKVDGADFVRYEEQNQPASPELMQDYQGMEGTSVLTAEDSLIEYEFTVEEEGLYDLSVLYYPVKGKNSAIQRSIFLDGALPYEELSLVEFQRVWMMEDTGSYVNEDGVTVRSWEKDNQGNDLKPACVEAPEWIDSCLYDSEGYVTTQLSLYLTVGEHTVSMVGLREPMLIRSLQLSNHISSESYETVKAAQDALCQAGSEFSGGISCQRQGTAEQYHRRGLLEAERAVDRMGV